MKLVDRGYLVLSHGEQEEISLNELRRIEFEFLKSLVEPFVEGVWVCVCVWVWVFESPPPSLSYRLYVIIYLCSMEVYSH